MIEQYKSRIDPRASTSGRYAPIRKERMSTIRFFDEDLSAAKGHICGTHRTRTPTETLEQYWPMAPRMGITRLADITGLDSIGLPVYTAIRPNSRSLATSQGKGIDVASAKVSALMESIESWHAENIDASLRWDSYLGLRRRATVIDVTQILRPHNRTIHLDIPGLWIEGYDILQQCRVWVPFDVVSLNFVTEGGLNSIPFLQSSTGLASGNHILEAISHGICEAIERDAESLWINNERDIRIDLATIDDSSCQSVLSRLDQVGIKAGVWDITSEIGVPAYACVIMDRPDPVEWRLHGAYSGFGCHLSPEIALLRALTEAVQSRATFIAGSRDDMFRGNYVSVQLDEAQRRRWNELCSPISLYPFSRHQALQTNSFEEDITVLLSRLFNVGIRQVIVVDLTKQDIGIPVAKLIIPSLEEAGEGIIRQKKVPRQCR